MIVQVWWEDSRSVRAKGYGPNALLLACVADELHKSPKVLEEFLEGWPLNGAGNVRKRLKEDGNSPHICGVFDRDKVLDLWAPGKKPPVCKAGICAALRVEAPGDYYLVLLFQNLESLVDASARALGVATPKKGHEARDKVLGQLAWHSDLVQRNQVRLAIDGFDRLVKWAAVGIQASMALRAMKK